MAKNSSSLKKDPNTSKSILDQSAEEIKTTEPQKPYNFISEKIKQEALSKLKNKEKQTTNWVNESENSQSLSYSKVFKASGGRDYANIANNRDVEGSERKKKENFSKIMGFDDGQANKFTSYNQETDNQNQFETSRESLDSEPSGYIGMNSSFS